MFASHFQGCGLLDRYSFWDKPKGELVIVMAFLISRQTMDIVATWLLFAQWVIEVY